MAGNQYIGGQARVGTSGATHDVINPANGSVVATVDLAGPDDVNAAVTAAADAQKDWGRAAPGVRAAALNELAAVLTARAEELSLIHISEPTRPY